MRYGYSILLFTLGIAAGSVLAQAVIEGTVQLPKPSFDRGLNQRYGTTHTEFEVQPNLEEVLDHAVDAFDEPFADDSVIPTYYICKLAREHVTVALTGLGGDELFGGYERYLGLKLDRNRHAAQARVS